MAAITLSGEPVQAHRTTECRTARWRSGAATALWLAVLAWPRSNVLAQAPDAASQAVYDHAAARIDVGGGRRLNLVCSGNPDAALPTVVFDSGLSDWSFSWALVQPAIARATRACSFDRAGLGFSDPARRSSTSAHAVEDLHRLLERAAIAPPYLLVGHSLGGLDMQLYAARYRNQVGAMLLVDPVTPDSTARLDARSAGAESRRLNTEVACARACQRSARSNPASVWEARCIEPDDTRYSAAVNATRRAIARRRSFQQAQLSELTGYASGVSLAEVRRGQRHYGALPLVVLSAARGDPALDAEWQTMHRALAARSSLGRQRNVPASGHYVQLDAPQVVIDALLELLQQPGSATGAQP